MSARRYKNRAHQGAYENGARAAAAGRQRIAPYDAADQTSNYFRRAWLAGYDETKSAASFREVK